MWASQPKIGFIRSTASRRCVSALSYDHLPEGRADKPTEFGGEAVVKKACRQSLLTIGSRVPVLFEEPNISLRTVWATPVHRIPIERIMPYAFVEFCPDISFRWGSQSPPVMSPRSFFSTPILSTTVREASACQDKGTACSRKWPLITKNWALLGCPRIL